MLLNTYSDRPNNYLLSSERIDIWAFQLNELPPLAHLLLNNEEQARANRFYFDRHRRRFTIARAMLRLILGRYVQQKAGDLIFTYNTHGKPQLDFSPIEFNLSHSADLALLAVGYQFSLGIDLEFFSARPYDGIANDLFSEQELELFLPLPNSLKPQAFFKIWAQKEAFIKACGLGLAYPTKLVDMPVFSANENLIKDKVYQKEWLMTPFMPQIACSAAICYHPQITQIRYTFISDINHYFNDQ